MESALAKRGHLPCRICSTPVSIPALFKRVKTAVCSSCAHEGLNKIVTIRLIQEQIVDSFIS
jgi:hypothetical protein